MTVVGDEALLMINHVGVTIVEASETRGTTVQCTMQRVQPDRGHHCSETTLTDESRFHIIPPRGFEPVTLVAGSKQVSPLDQ